MIWQGPNSYVDIKTPCSSSYTGRWHCNVQLFCSLLWPCNLRLSSWASEPHVFCSVPSLYRLYCWQRIVHTPSISQISPYAAQEASISCHSLWQLYRWGNFAATVQMLAATVQIVFAALTTQTNWTICWRGCFQNFHGLNSWESEGLWVSSSEC